MADPTAIARDYLESWNRRDWSHIRELMHRDYSYTGGDGKVQQGIDAGLAVSQMFANAFPDGRIETKKVFACGDNAAIVEFIGSGTHKGELMGIAPTGRRITIPVCDVLEFREGKIVTEHEYMDMMTMMQQLGVVPTETKATA
jgi:steroid delta-isomerase-like uncharacterized protein